MGPGASLNEAVVAAFTEIADLLDMMMAIDSGEQGTVITTTGPHMARDIGNPLQHAYRGKLAIDYRNMKTGLHVYWHRN